MRVKRDIGKATRVVIHGQEYVPAEDYDRLLDSYRKALRPVQAAADTPNLNTEAWQQWLHYRRDLGKPAYKTDRVARWLAQYPSRTQLEIVQRSVAKEWSGLYDPPSAEPYARRAPPQVEEKYL